MALYKSTDILRASNMHLFKYLEKSTRTLKGSNTLYMDLMHSDHNITINTEEKFHQLTIGNTTHSLHGLAQAKVIWLVYKEENTLLRVEGGLFRMPLKNEDRVEIDVINKNMSLFRVYKSKKKDKILAMMQVKGQEPQIFMTQNIPSAPISRDNNRTTNGANGLASPNNPNNPNRPGGVIR